MALSEDTAGPDKNGYWRATIRLTIYLLVIWFVVSYGAGILFKEQLDKISLFGAPFGFWMSQNGSIYIFVILIFYYCRKMNQYEKKFGVDG